MTGAADRVTSTPRPVPAGERVQVYAVAPRAAAGRRHQVRVLGRRVLVERFGGASHVRFGMRGPVTVEIEVDDPITGHRVFPAERAAVGRVAGTVLTLEVPAPLAFVVWIDGLEPLFMLLDPIEESPPLAGATGVVDARDDGADPTGLELATAGLQAALDRASAMDGGGVVVLERGLYRTGTLALRSGVTLYLAPGAVLQGSRDPADYPLDPGRRESVGDASLAPDARFLGRTMTFSRLLLVDRAEGVRIAGRGTIDGDGTFLRTHLGAAPNLLRVRESADVAIEDVLFRDAAAWSLHVLASRDVAFRNVKVINDRANLNTDGIDIDMSSDVTVDGSFIHTKDDAVCIKATGNSDLSGNPARITVTGNLVSSVDAALKVGTESEAERFSDIVFEDNQVFDSGRAMSVVVRDGATYERVTYRGVRIGPNVEHLVEQVIGVRDPAAALGAIRDLAIEDVTAPTFTPPASNWTWYAQFRPSRPAPGSAVNVFEGADEAHAVDGLAVRGLVVNGERIADAAGAARLAGLTVGPHVRRVTFG